MLLVINNYGTLVGGAQAPMLYNQRPGRHHRLYDEDLRMKWTVWLLMFALVSLVGGLVAAQDTPKKNPLEGNADAIRAGMGVFRARCADCHGMDARGVRSPDLTQVWASGAPTMGCSGRSGTAYPTPRCRPIRA